MKGPKQRIRITSPSITKKEINLVTKAVTDGWKDKAFSYVHGFEKEFAKHIGVKYAIATSSCTGALHIICKALDLSKGDEVIVPDITWAGTAFPIAYVQAKPIFADILPDTWCIDPESIKKNITSKTKAIMPVHLFGNPADMDVINNIAKENKLFVIEDAAQAIGTTYKGKRAGSMSDIAAFSFTGTKTLTTGEGGMIVTNNTQLYERALFFSNQAKSANRLFWNEDIGLKYKMTNMQAALGLAQLSRVKELLRKKRQIFFWYQKLFHSVPSITMNIEKSYSTNTYWMPTIIWDEKIHITKEHMMNILLTKYNIDPRPFFYPLSQLPPFKIKVDNPIAYSLSTRAINLPCGYDLTFHQAKYVVNAILEILEHSI